MDNKRKVMFGLFSVGALTGAIACSSTTTTTTSTPSGSDAGKEGGSSSSSSSGSTSSSSGSTSSSSSSSSGLTSSSSGSSGDTACAKEATFDACGSCCTQAHQAGATTFTKSLLGCACEGQGADGGTGPCATDCADTACAGKQPDATCNKCLQESVGKDGACLDKVSTDCNADNDCVAEQKCIGSCPQQ